MHTALDRDPAGFDEHESKFVAQIRQHGWFRTGVQGKMGLPSFSYTTGFWCTLGFPEIVVFSLKPEAAHDLVRQIFGAVRAGERLGFGKRAGGILSKLDVALLPVDKRHYTEHLGWSRWFYGGDDFPSVQLVWPDRQNRFPWEGAFDGDYARAQPNLTDDSWAPALQA